MNLDDNYTLGVVTLTLVLLLIQTARAAYWRGRAIGWKKTFESNSEECHYIRDRFEEATDTLRDIAASKDTPPTPP